MIIITTAITCSHSITTITHHILESMRSTARNDTPDAEKQVVVCDINAEMLEVGKIRAPSVLPNRSDIVGMFVGHIMGSVVVVLLSVKLLLVLLFGVVDGSIVNIVVMPNRLDIVGMFLFIITRLQSE